MNGVWVARRESLWVLLCSTAAAAGWSVPLNLSSSHQEFSTILVARENRPSPPLGDPHLPNSGLAEPTSDVEPAPQGVNVAPTRTILTTSDEPGSTQATAAFRAGCVGPAWDPGARYASLCCGARARARSGAGWPQALSTPARAPGRGGRVRRTSVGCGAGEGRGSTPAVPDRLPLRISGEHVSPQL